MKPTQRMGPVKRFVAVRMVPALVVLVSVSFIGLGVQTTRLARESHGWPSVDGEIVKSDIVEETSSARTGRGTVTYRPTIRYRYRVGDADYTGERVALGEYATEDRAAAEGVVRQYPTGRRLPVHYRPRAPDVAVLEVGDHGLPWFYVALGSVFLLAGLMLAWVAPRLIAPADVT
jgi:hypothetical protein